MCLPFSVSGAFRALRGISLGPNPELRASEGTLKIIEFSIINPSPFPERELRLRGSKGLIKVTDGHANQSARGRDNYWFHVTKKEPEARGGDIDWGHPARNPQRS